MSPLRLSFLLNFVLFFFPELSFRAGLELWKKGGSGNGDLSELRGQRSGNDTARGKRWTLQTARRRGWWEALTGTSHGVFVDSVTLLT